MAIQHYSFPSYNDLNDTINLDQFTINQPLVVRNINTSAPESYGVYIVVNKHRRSRRY